MHTCEELVQILHAREKVAQVLHRCDECLSIIHTSEFFITKYRHWPYVELIFDNCDLAKWYIPLYFFSWWAHSKPMPPSSVGQHFIGSPHPHSQLNSNFGRRGEIGNMSGYRCVSDCISRGSELDPGPVPLIMKRVSTVIFLPFADHWRRVVSYKRKYVHEVLVYRLFKLAQEKVWV